MKIIPTISLQVLVRTDRRGPGPDVCRGGPLGFRGPLDGSTRDPLDGAGHHHQKHQMRESLNIDEEHRSCSEGFMMEEHLNAHQDPGYECDSCGWRRT